MNEKIKQLAKQAGLNFGTNISGVELVYGTFEGSTISHIDSDELAKFAELIVRECMRAVESNRKEPREGYNTYNMGTFEAVDSIKQHFGIEE